MKRPALSIFVALVAFGLTGCSSMKVKLSGDRGVNYRAAWTDDDGYHTENGALPKTFRIPEGRFVGWFQNTTSSGEFRVRVYQGWSLLTEATTINSAERINVERRGKGVAVSR